MNNLNMNRKRKHENLFLNCPRVFLTKLPVLPLKLSKEKGNYSEPREIGNYSLDSQRIMNLKTPCIKYYFQPELNSDLNEGYPHKFKQRDPNVDEKLDHLLKFIQSKKTSIIPLPAFITWRGILTKLMTTPYNRDPWELNILKYKGSIYMIENKSESQEEEVKNNESLDRFTYYGYKFENLSTIPCHPDKVTKEILESKKSEEVNTNEQYCSVFTSKLGNHNVLLGGEVDCLYFDPKTKRKEYMELKTNRLLTTPSQEYNFKKYKLLKIWCQSYLSGVGRILLGFRDDHGILKDIKYFSTNGIWNEIKTENESVKDKSRLFWDKQVCLIFASDLLDFIQKNVQGEKSDVYCLNRQGNYISLYKYSNPDDKYFLPDWFKE